MNKELNYFAFIVVLSFGYFIGLFFPDIDQGMQGLLGHRSIITHSILLPYLLYSYFKKKNNLTPLKTIFIVGIYLGIGLHLSADLHPKAFRGFALIKLPFNIDIGGLSPIWIGINAGVALFLASTFLNQLTNKKLFWITYLLIALFVGLTYADEEPYNNDAIIGTFIFLLFVTFIFLLSVSTTGSSIIEVWEGFSFRFKSISSFFSSKAGNDWSISFSFLKNH